MTSSMTLVVVKQDPPQTQSKSGSYKVVPREVEAAHRRRLPDERECVTHAFTLGGFKSYVRVGMFEDGLPGEVFITTGQLGSTVDGFVNAWAMMVSLALQYGVPLAKVVEKHRGMRFEPYGWTERYGEVSSILDYVARWLEERFLVSID